MLQGEGLLWGGKGTLDDRLPEIYPCNPVHPPTVVLNGTACTAHEASSSAVAAKSRPAEWRRRRD